MAWRRERYLKICYISIEVVKIPLSLGVMWRLRLLWSCLSARVMAAALRTWAGAVTKLDLNVGDTGNMCHTIHMHHGSGYTCNVATERHFLLSRDLLVLPQTLVNNFYSPRQMVLCFLSFPTSPTLLPEQDGHETTFKLYVRREVEINQTEQLISWI